MPSRESEQTSIGSFITRELGKTIKEARQMMTETTETRRSGNSVGAASHKAEEWHSIDWAKAHHIVRRLQARIVKATQEQKWGKVKALQRLLTHSLSGKVLAVKRVTENQGKRTPGVDGKTWKTPQEKAMAIQMLRQRGYHPQPLRRIYIPKSNGGKRPLSIPCMLCRAMQALYLLALDPVAETTADPNSYGFRKERSPADAIEQCFKALGKARSPQWILEGDIKACFDKISHEWLLAHIPMDKSILRKWLKAGFIEKQVLHPTEEGTPQGGICSPVIANLTLDGLERELLERYPKPKNGYNAKVNFVRFADDFIVTGISKALLEQEVKPLIEQFMRERGLALSQEKTVITHIEDGFDFLGQNVRKYNGKLIIKPSRKNVSAFLRKVRTLIKTSKQATAGNLIVQLNPLIRGWANYHQHVVSKVTFARVGHAIFQALWRWARRRHPNKAKQWIKERYFKSINGKNWVFYGTIATKDGLVENRLLHPAYVPIKRHVKIKGEANPYDPAWEEYFEKRLGVKMVHNLKGKRQLSALWKEQNGLCPICQQKITKLTGWHNHHLVWRVNGGKDVADNRVLLHPNCHRQVHSQRLEVVKPRPARGGRKA
jgi:RNA-directed DNA polymerase